MAETKEGSGSEMSLKDQGNEFFKSGKYLKAAALYTQAIKQDPSNPTLYRYLFSFKTFTFFHLGVIVQFFQSVGFKICFSTLLFPLVYFVSLEITKGFFFFSFVVIILLVGVFGFYID